MRKLGQKLEMVANLAIIVMVVMLGILFVRHWKSGATVPPERKPPTSESLVGKQISLSGVDWKKNGKTLVMAMQTRCHFCSESAPFYQELIKDKQPTVRFVAVLPNPVQESEGYLKSLGVAVDEVLQAPLNSLGVRGTPTLLMVDDSGTVRNAWLGRLDAEHQRDVVGKLRS